jgi:hypothetical protein
LVNYNGVGQECPLIRTSDRYGTMKLTMYYKGVRKYPRLKGTAAEVIGCMDSKTTHIYGIICVVLSNLIQYLLHIYFRITSELLQIYFRNTSEVLQI